MCTFFQAADPRILGKCPFPAKVLDSDAERAGRSAPASGASGASTPKRLEEEMGVAITGVPPQL